MLAYWQFPLAFILPVACWAVPVGIAHCLFAERQTGSHTETDAAAAAAAAVVHATCCMLMLLLFCLSL